MDRDSMLVGMKIMLRDFLTLEVKTTRGLYDNEPTTVELKVMFDGEEMTSVYLPDIPGKN